MNKENFNDDKVVLLYGPILVTPTISVDTDEVAMAGFESVTFYILTGTSGDTPSGSNNIACDIEAATTTGGSFNSVAATEVVTSDSTPVNDFGVINAPGDLNSVSALGYKGNLGFVRVAITKTGTLSNGIALCVIAVLSNPTLVSTGQTVRSS